MLNSKLSEKVTGWQPSATTLPPIIKQPTTSAVTRALRIAFCLPEREWITVGMGQAANNAAYIQQNYIAGGLRRNGHQLTWIAPYDLNRLICTDDPERLTCAPQGWTATRGFDLLSRSTWRLQQAVGLRYLNLFANCRRFDASLRCLPGHDLVYERNGIYNVGVAMACQRLRLPYILFFDADQIAEHDYMGKPIIGWQRWIAQRYLRYNLRVAGRIICVSEPARRHLITHWNVPAEKIVVFPNGVDTQRFQPDPTARAAERAQLGIGDAPLILFVGNFYEWHDVATLLHAFAGVVATDPTARLLLVGDGPQRQAMVRLANELNICHAVQFTGLVAHAEVPRLMAAADIAVAPVPAMDHEMWLSPMKLFEYMASGVAIVASAVGQLAEVIQSGRNGCLVPPGDTSALAGTLQQLLDDPAFRMRLGHQARKDAVHNYSWEEYLSRLEGLYAAVLTEQCSERR